MVPTRLATKETFMLISSSESINMALSKTSKVYVFGLMKTQGRQELIKFQQTPFPESVHYVACGPQHFLAIDDQGSAYSWGSTTNGRLGHSLTGLSMINQSARQRSLDIVLSAPVLIDSVQTLLGKDTRKVKRTKATQATLRFPVQLDLKEQAITEENIMA